MNTVPSAIASDDEATWKKALLLSSQQKYAEAIPLYRSLLPAHMNSSQLWAHLGDAFCQTRDYPLAAAFLRRSLEIDPDSYQVWMIYARCLNYLNRIDEAYDIFSKLLLLRPDDPEIHFQFGGFLLDTEKLEEAYTRLDIACQLQPDNAAALSCRAFSHLKAGRFKEGWKEFASRHRLETKSNLTKRREAQTAGSRWEGQPLKNKTILIYDEQGFGDTILMSRYIPMVKERGGRVILKCRKQLRRLLQNVSGIDYITESDVLEEKVDYHVPLMDLPAIFGTELSSIPSVPDLYVPTALPEKASHALSLGKDRLRVGIVWTGSLGFSDNHRRAVALTRFLPLAEVSGIQLYSLQKGPAEKELADAQGLIIELGPHLNDFADTAAVIAQLDLLIMTDNSVAHLAGSLGKPVWNLLPYSAYWLYMTEREDSPWYPSMRLFRQSKPGDWDGVFKKVTQELTKLATS